MAYFRDGISKIVFPFVYIMILAESMTVAYVWDEDKESWLFYTKLLYLFNTAMSIWSHIMATITDPGAITHENNIHVLEIYINLRSHCVKNADNFNAKFRSVLLKMKDEELQESDSDLDNSDYGFSYNIHSDIRDAAMEDIAKEYRIKLTRCKRCLVVRPARCHHCTRCKKCYMKKDHHCPWINNCIGAFNQKHFILFNYYSLNGILLSVYMLLYYLMYKHKSIYTNSNWLITMSVFHLLFSLIFIIFSICMLKDQIANIRNETALIDPKKKIFIEARDIDECWNEAFGEPFHIRWFFPVNKNSVRDTYIKGKIEEPTEEEKKQYEKERMKKELEKKEKIERGEIDPAEEGDFEEMLRNAVKNMKEQKAKQEAEEAKKPPETKPVVNDKRKPEEAPSNSNSYEEMIKKARESVYQSQPQTSGNKADSNKNAGNTVQPNEQVNKTTKDSTNNKSDVHSKNKQIEKTMNKAVENFQEYYNTVADDNDSDDSQELESRQSEINEADELLGKLNDFMGTMKSKIEENKKKALEKKLEAQKRKAAKKEKFVETQTAEERLKDN